MTEKIQNILAEFRQQLARIYGERLVKVILFGSQAREDARPGWDSDVDVLVVLKGPVDVYEEIKRTSEICADINLRTGELINTVFMDDRYFAERNGPLLRNIRSEGIAV